MVLEENFSTIERNRVKSDFQNKHSMTIHFTTLTH